MDQVTAVEEPRERLLDLVGRIFPLELTEEVAKAAAAISYRRRQRTIELAMEEELPVFRVEAHGIGRQQIDAEVRRKLRNVLAAAQRWDALTVAPRSAAARLGALADGRPGRVL